MLVTHFVLIVLEAMNSNGTAHYVHAVRRQVIVPNDNYQSDIKCLFELKLNDLERRLIKNTCLDGLV